MVKQSEAALALLGKVTAARQAEKDWLEEFDRRKREEREAGREAFQEELTQFIATALSAGIPKAQVAKAYGTSIYKNIPMATEAAKRAEELRDDVLRMVYSAQEDKPKPEVTAPTPVQKTTKKPKFDPAAVEFADLEGTYKGTNDFGVPIWIEEWQVEDPSGVVESATVYYPQEGHEDDARWGINLIPFDHTDELVGYTLAVSETNDEQTYQTKWEEKK